MSARTRPAEGASARATGFVHGALAGAPGDAGTTRLLFTLEGMIRGLVRLERGLGFTPGVVHHAWARWAAALDGPVEGGDGWLCEQDAVHGVAGADPATREVLAAATCWGRPHPVARDSTDALLPAAAFGLLAVLLDPAECAEHAAAATACTHGPGPVPAAAGALAHLVALRITGTDLGSAAAQVRARHALDSGSRCERAVHAALTGTGPEGTQLAAALDGLAGTGAPPGAGVLARIGDRLVADLLVEAGFQAEPSTRTRRWGLLYPGW